MIISDEHRFAFIHIPKCGGSSVSSQLRGIDSYHGKFSADGPHEHLGYIYFCHLPLQTLRDHFPEEFHKVTEYDSVAFVREPHARFASALMQYVRTYKIPQFRISAQAAAAEAAGVIEHLRRKPQTLEAAYAMFLPQTPFTTLNHKVLIKHLFLLGQMAEFADFVRMKTGICLRFDSRDNQSAVPSFAIVKSIASILRHAYWQLPQSVRHSLIRAAIASGLYKSATEELSRKLSESHEIRNFIDDYYAEDIMLFKSLTSAQTGATFSETAA